MTYIERVISAFGSQAKLAQAINVPKTTVNTWVSAKSVPRWRVLAIEQAAKDRGIDISNAPDAT